MNERSRPIALCFALVTLAACSSEASSAPVPAPAAAPAGDIVVDASPDAREATGVAVWTVDDLSGDLSSMAVHGYDAACVEIVAFGMATESEDAVPTKFEVIGRGKFGEAHLAVEMTHAVQGDVDHVTMRASDNTFASNQAAKTMLDWAQKDLGTQVPRVAEAAHGGLVGTSSLQPENLISDWGKGIVKAGKCMVTDGKCAKGALVMVGKTALTGMACLDLTTAPADIAACAGVVTCGLGVANLGAAAYGCYDGIENAGKSREDAQNACHDCATK